jgi:hypothetical protein
LVDPFGEGWWQQEFNRRRSRRHLSRRRRARHSLDRLKSAVPRGLKDPVKRWLGR